MTTPTAFAHLSSTCAAGCRGRCWEIAKQAPNGRWFITMGHAGFNSRANNGRGYASRFAAENASLRYLGKGR